MPSLLAAQGKMRLLNELINKDESGWDLVQEWVTAAENKVEILSADPVQAADALYNIQVTTKSPMGAMVYNSGGMLVDGGWIRILGSGNSKLNRSLPGWNKSKNLGDVLRFLLIADDVVGGFFILNGGGLGSDIGKVYYLAPNTLQYEPLDLSYSEFLHFCFNGDLDSFYDGLRWKNWKSDLEQLPGDSVYSFYPYLWSQEGKDINILSRTIVPVEEQYDLILDLRKQLKLN